MACSATCSVCSMKPTDAVSGAFSVAGRVRNIHCAVCRVQCAACPKWKLSMLRHDKANKITSKNKFPNIFFVLAEWNKKLNFILTNHKYFFLIILQNTSFLVQDVCKSIFLVIDIYSMYKHTPKVGVDYWFSLNRAHWANSVIESPCPCVFLLSVCVLVRKKVDSHFYMVKWSLMLHRW